MIIYNQTINIDESIHDKWLRWMQEKHINDVLATSKFTSARLVKVLVDEEMGGTTYSVQFTAENMSVLQRYYAENAASFKNESLEIFGNKILTFETELELISEH